MIKVDDNVFPSDYKEDIIYQLRQQLDDPYDVRDAFIAAPVLKTSLGHHPLHRLHPVQRQK